MSKTVNDRIFLSGWCLCNPGPGAWSAVTVTGNFVSEFAGREESSTGNVVQLLAAINALSEVATSSAEIEVYSSSTYLVDGISKWVKKWKQQGWKKNGPRHNPSKLEDIANEAMWRKLDVLNSEMSNRISWRFLPAFYSVPGQERANQLVEQFIFKKETELFLRLPYSDYMVDMYDLTPRYDEASFKKHKKATQKERAQTWEIALD